MSLLYEFAAALLAVGHACMIESPMHPDYATRDLHTLYHQPPYRLVHIHGVCPRDVQRQRWEQRLLAGARHSGHGIADGAQIQRSSARARRSLCTDGP